jgi:hypothetical protein
MEGYVTIKKADLVEAMWGICLSDHLGDVWDSIGPLVESLGISGGVYGDDLLDKMKRMDLIPDYQRD